MTILDWDHDLSPIDDDAALEVLRDGRRSDDYWRRRVWRATSLVLDGYCAAGCGQQRLGSALTCGWPQCLDKLVNEWPSDSRFELEQRVRMLEPRSAQRSSFLGWAEALSIAGLLVALGALLRTHL